MKFTKIFIFSFLCAFSFSGCTKRIYFHVKETLDNGIIACKGPSCETIVKIAVISNNIFVPTTGSEHIKLFEPLMVFIENNNNIDDFYYDNQDFSIPVNDIKQEGTYKYQTMDGKIKTIPIIKFLKTNKIKEENLAIKTYNRKRATLRPFLIDGYTYEAYKAIVEDEENKDAKQKKITPLIH